MAECIMTCLFKSLEKMSEGKRRVFFYASFIVGGTLTIGGFAGFATQHRGYAFIVVVSGIFILITTGILWDSLIPHCDPSPRAPTETPTAPREEDDPPPDYETVVRGDSTKYSSVSRTNSKYTLLRSVETVENTASKREHVRWSLYNQNWCPSFNPKSGYGKTATSEPSCTEIVVSDRPPAYGQSQSQKRHCVQNLPASANEMTSVTEATPCTTNEVTDGPSHPITACVQITRETKLECFQN
ncbi:uncharacterized protein LOC111259306 isoform X2 [Varroa jacobsoni]|uniref:uncharacterized protein LOC111259306 isoform X2 n=1 Tax=Varroa jacobsoni TaxID=62625 RepID=UPI000BF654A2|nr:uncharacterized protein LOC111259306 isoform X2 [Varroa jacobsoni]XP_022686948.1 uncharacterized protein LOC111259306 isoform X2 [Varroa jacobsoni]XP_022686949.1 uncharacterized protein LOC111259306 isoform X2 [Varroa jacobsoni]